MSQEFFLVGFYTLILMLLKVKSHVREQGKALKDTSFLLIKFTVQSPLVLKKDIFIFKISHGVRKVPKKCHVLFEWPLSLVHTHTQGKKVIKSFIFPK